MNTIEQLKHAIQGFNWSFEIGTTTDGLFVATIDSGGEESHTSQACYSRIEALHSAFIGAVINMELEGE